MKNMIKCVKIQVNMPKCVTMLPRCVTNVVTMSDDFDVKQFLKLISTL